ncbi:MAG: HDOD domain-containing protein [Herbaspirillum sp.]
MFIDDDPRVLAGLERALAVQDHGWHCRFADSGAAALAQMTELAADVVVSDMRMPVMDGAELLGKVRDRWPQAVRIVLSGYSDPDLTRRMLEVAHQFIAKPCDTRQLVSAIERATTLRDMFSDAAVVATISRVSHLPAAPRVFNAVTQLLNDPAGNARAVAALIGRDPALAAKVLQLANSAFFGSGRPVHDVGAAIARLGMDMVRLLVLAAQAFEGADQDPLIDTLQRRALAAACLATDIAGRPGAAATAALLAHIGLMVPELRRAPPPEPITQCGAPLHAAVGAYLLGLWGLPVDIVHAVACHHQPMRGEAGFGLTGVVHAATAIAHVEQPDFDYLAHVGVQDRWPVWLAAHDATVDELAP